MHRSWLSGDADAQTGIAMGDDHGHSLAIQAPERLFISSRSMRPIFPTHSEDEVIAHDEDVADGGGSDMAQTHQAKAAIGRRGGWE